MAMRATFDELNRRGSAATRALTFGELSLVLERLAVQLNTMDGHGICGICRRYVELRQQRRHYEVHRELADQVVQHHLIAVERRFSPITPDQKTQDWVLEPISTFCAAGAQHVQGILCAPSYLITLLNSTRLTPLQRRAAIIRAAEDIEFRDALCAAQSAGFVSAVVEQQMGTTRGLD